MFVVLIVVCREFECAVFSSCLCVSSPARCTFPGLDQTEHIIAEIQRHGFTIVARQKQTITRAQGEEFYAELKGMSNRKTGQPILPPLLDFMTRCVAFVRNFKSAFSSRV